jgi:uncharacterized membrane protein HdeD (DUF308 family)
MLVIVLALWNRLYGLIWLAFLLFLLPALSGIVPYTAELHLLVGIAILILAYSNYRDIKKTSAPDRVKRISKTTLIITVLQPIFGLPLYASERVGFMVPYGWVVNLFHLIFGLAIIAQAASTATAYDMWEEKEFT